MKFVDGSKDRQAFLQLGHLWVRTLDGPASGDDFRHCASRETTLGVDTIGLFPVRGNAPLMDGKGQVVEGWGGVDVRMRKRSLRRGKHRTWLKPRPEPGLDCLICATFA